MEKERAERNRTISLTPSECEFYTMRCLSVDDLSATDEIEDRIVLGDTFMAMQYLPISFVDLLVVDPPYNITKLFGDSCFKKISDADYRKFTHRWITGIKHTLRPDASIYVCSDWKTSMIVGDVLSEYFTIQNRITWQREKGRGALHNWKNGMEDIWFATVSNNFTFNVDDVKMRRRVVAPYKVDGKPKDWMQCDDGNFRDTYPSNFWDDISIPYWSMPENTDHPTQKPEKLLAKLVLASSNVGDMIFDPFIGSGTTAVVSKKLGRRFLGIEHEREYCAIAQRRLELATKNRQIQGYSGGVFWERNTLVLQQKETKKVQTTGNIGGNEKQKQIIFDAVNR